MQQAKLVLAGVGGLELYSELHYLLGLVTLYHGNPSEARQLLAESLSLCINNQEEVRAARVCTYLADAALWESKLDEAEHWLSQSLVYHSEPQRITIYTVERLLIAARLATAQQQYPRAATLFGLADQIHSQVHYAIGGPMRALADAALATVQAALKLQTLPRRLRQGSNCRNTRPAFHSGWMADDYQQRLKGSAGRRSITLPCVSPSKPISIWCWKPADHVITPLCTVAWRAGDQAACCRLCIRTAVISWNPSAWVMG